MSGNTRLVAAIAGGIVVVVLIVVAALLITRQSEVEPSEPGRWPASERASFVESCVKSCRASPGVTADRYPLCDRACTCSADEAEKMVTAQELVDMYKAMQAGKATKEQNEKLERMKAAGVACANQGDKK